MGARKASLNPDRELQAYVVGLAIGDGKLSNPNGRAVRLRISCDTMYVALTEKIACALKICIPEWIYREYNPIVPCLRGLIETDGSIYRDRGYLNKA